MRSSQPTAAALPVKQNRHESFLVFTRYRYLKLAVLLALTALILYLLDSPYGTHYGGSWVGYTLGIGGALLILWLTWFGYRKRSYTTDAGALVNRLSAHVYLGLALLFVVTLHTGFHFGWNAHTLAYALMCLVIFSGIVGVFCYARYPQLMTENRAGMTMQQMLGSIATLDDQLRIAALPLDETTATIVQRAVEATAIGGSVWRQLTGRQPNCATVAAISHLDGQAANVTIPIEDSWRQVRVLLGEKAALLLRVRRDIRYKAMMEVWLYFHVPLSFMLLAALLAHIVSIFFLW